MARSEAAISTITPDALDKMTFAAGSMGPKIAAASAFVRAGGKLAGIGTLQDARAILEGRAGTLVTKGGAIPHGHSRSTQDTSERAALG